MDRFSGLLGIVAFIGVGLLMSADRKKVPWRLVCVGVLSQFVLAVVILRVPGVREFFDVIAWLVNGVLRQADAGIEFVFGANLSDPSGPWGFIFAVRALPVIIFFAALMSVLYYLGVMQRIVAALAWLLRRTLGVSGAEAMAMAANVFVGQTEAPLTIRPLIEGMTRAQLMTLMVGGFATIAGSVMASYVLLLGGDDDAMRVLYAKHLLTASVMSAPAAFVMSRLILPELETPPVEEHINLSSVGREGMTNLFDAAAAGATDGLKLALNVAGMLIAFVGLLALINWPLESLSAWGPIAEWRAEAGVPVVNLQTLLGWVFAPLSWLMGVPWSDAPVIGTLMGEKLIATEFVAYVHLAQMLRAEEAVLSARSAQIATYALCGFANFASIAIQIGGLTSLAPGRRKDFAQLALKAMIGGACASWMTASVAGMFIAS